MVNVYINVDLCTRETVVYYTHTSLRYLVDLDHLQRVYLNHFEQLRRVRNRHHLLSWRARLK